MFINHSSLKANQRKFYLSSFFGGWTFATGFLVFYYREIGFSYLQIFAVAILYEGLNFLLEIPTGVLADLWSRKWTITIGHAISGTSFFIVMFYPEAYAMYLVWSILSAISSTLNSGTVMAIVYDSLRAIDEENQFAKIQGRLVAITLIMQAIAFALGGLLADTFGFRLVLLLSGVGGLLQALVLATLAEPPVFPEDGEETSNVKEQKQTWWQQFTHQIVSSFIIMFRPSIRWVLIYGILGFAMYEFQRIVTQPYLVSLGYDSRFAISLFSAGFALVTAVASILTGQLKSPRNETSLLILISVGMTLPYIVIGVTKGYIGIGALFISYVAMGGAGVVLPDIMNKLIPPDKRATILSAQNQLGSISYAIIGIALGTVMDQIGLSTSMLLIGVVSTALFTLLLFTKPRSNINQQDA